MTNGGTEPAPAAPENSRGTLGKFLDQLIQDPSRYHEVTRLVDEVFGQEKAVMVCDMSGFSRTTQRHGIVSFLLMIHQVQRLARPVVLSRRGHLVKTEADNLFCLFGDVNDAIGAALEITERLAVVNLIPPEDRQLYISIGIGHGRILNIADEELFGNEVNLASKLGEDVAKLGEILLTPSGQAAAKVAGVSFRRQLVSVSGLDLEYFYVERQGEDSTAE